MVNFEYFKPESLMEARKILIEYGEDGHILNGGTDLIVRMRGDITKPKAVVDIKGIDELHNIEFDEMNGLTVGACVNLNDMLHNDIVMKKYDFLSKAAKSIGSGQVRNRATMVGNNCNASPLADTSTPLYVLDANVIIYGENGKFEVPIVDFYKGVRKTCLNSGEIVTGIRIPYYEGMKGVFKKNSRRSTVDLSTVCTSVVKIGDEFRIGLGAVAPTPIRASEAEKYLEGKELNEDVIGEASKIAASCAKPIDDVRASKEYRIEMVRVLVMQSLQELS